MRFWESEEHQKYEIINMSRLKNMKMNPLKHVCVGLSDWEEQYKKSVLMSWVL